MTSQFSPKVSQILAFSREEATRLASRSVGPEHLLLGILRERQGVIIDIFNSFNVDIQDVKTQLEENVREDELNEPLITSELVLNDKASNILKLAVLEARIQHTQTVDVQHLLLAILHDQVENGAKEVLEFYNMNYEDTLKYLQKRTSSTNAKDGVQLPDEEDDEDDPMYSPENSGNNRQSTTQTARHGKGKTPILDNFSTDLTKAAAEGKLDPVVGREKEIERVTEILGRRKKNNPILIGEPGVGKSAIVEGLAELINKHHTSPILFNHRVVSLDMTAIVAGTKYRGQFEERIRALIKELEQNPDIIVFIDEIHTIIGAGSTPGTMDAANILKPALARGTIQCIGATTLDEYRNSIEKDGALERRFQKVMVEPTTTDETLQILNNIKERYEAHHHVSYKNEAITACVKLTEKYVTDRFFPDKAIDVLDEVGSRIHLKHATIPPEVENKEKEIEVVKAKKRMAVQNQNFELAASFRDQQTELEKELVDIQNNWATNIDNNMVEVTENDVEDVVSFMTGIPVQRMAESENIRLKNMSGDLENVVIGQNNAIEKMVKAIQRNRMGLKDPNHPIGAFMFLGPTGVGKTYLAKQLAKKMFGSADALIRIDMSEYTESFNTSRLIGAPPGYVGYEEGGQLTEQVRRHPYSIVLLDEIEKAHGNVFNLLLQVLDEGRLTDGNGRLIDFRNTVIIMTSNAGTRQLKEFAHGVGFNAGNTTSISKTEQDKEYARSIIQKNLSKQFSPEFLNRLDEIVTFDQLDMDSIKKIIDLELKGLISRIYDLGYTINITDKAKEFVATKGYDVQFGARPLKRAIQNYIEDGVCEMLLDGELQQGDNITVGKASNKNSLTFHKVSKTIPDKVGTTLV
jgi:ATP-dependent Clp protease ATP-binding subunit ClpC